MDTTKYDEIVYELNKNLLLASMLYYPEKLFDTDEVAAAITTATSSLDLVKSYSNSVFIIEADGSNYFLEGKESYSKIIQKKNLLENNIFMLLQLKKDIAEEAFDYMVGRYIERVMHLLVLANWFSDNAKKDMPSLKVEHLTSFRQQAKYLEDHLEELDRVVPIRNDSKKAAVNTAAATFKIAANELLEDKELKAIVEESVSLNYKDIKKENINKLKKEAKEQAESILLKRIFNVDIKIEK